MPSKSHRVAAKQAQLSRKKGRHKSEGRLYVHPAQLNPANTNVKESYAEPAQITRRRISLETTLGSTPVPQALTRPDHLFKELRRIGILSLLMLSIMGVLTIFLD